LQIENCTLRIEGRGADFITLRTAAGTARGVAGFRESQLAGFLEDPEGLLLRGIDRPVKISHEALIVEARLRVGGEVHHVALKRYRPRNWWKAFCGLFRRGRAMRSWRLAQSLRSHGIATPRPIAACSAHPWCPRRTSYLATEWIEGAEHLHQYGWRLAAFPSPARLRCAARCAESLGQLIGKMHAAGIAHRDLKAANLLVVDRDGSIATWLVDLDGVRIGRTVRPARRARDLARLAVGLDSHGWVTRAVCRRFLRAYTAQFPPGTIPWKVLWRETAGISRRMIERKRRCGEQVL
jgi:tRNA A-37 threonylcarbamoyl transferase component Bud32